MINVLHHYIKCLVIYSNFFSYHSGQDEDWGKYLGDTIGGRIVSIKVDPRSIDHAGDPHGMSLAYNQECGSKNFNTVPDPDYK